MKIIIITCGWLLNEKSRQTYFIFLHLLNWCICNTHTSSLPAIVCENKIIEWDLWWKSVAVGLLFYFFHCWWMECWSLVESFASNANNSTNISIFLLLLLFAFRFSLVWFFFIETKCNACTHFFHPVELKEKNHMNYKCK